MHMDRESLAEKSLSQAFSASNVDVHQGTRGAGWTIAR